MNKSYVETGRRAQKEKTRQTILKVTQSMLDQGKDFSLEDIAKSASISRATIYRYFSNVEVLSIEATLDLQSPDPTEVVEKCKAKNIASTFLNIQTHYNDMALNHESLFRTYMSALLNPSNSLQKRGARRVQALSIALDNFNHKLGRSEREKLLTCATALMGIEALIVAKDVRGLSNEDSQTHLRWGLENLLKNMIPG